MKLILIERKMFLKGRQKAENDVEKFHWQWRNMTKRTSADVTGTKT